MSLETGTYISDLVPTNPAGTDPKSQGDDHLRLIKDVLKNTFPQADGPIKIDKDVSILGDGTKVNIGNAAEDALQIDSVAKTIKPVSPYAFSGQQKGGTTAPAAGMIGEILTATGGPVDIGIAGAVANMTGITLTPGVWDVQVYGSFNFSAAGGSLMQISGSLTPGTLGSISNAVFSGTINQGIGQQMSGFLSRQVVTVNTAVACTARANGASGTCQCAGTITARRVA